MSVLVQTQLHSSVDASNSQTISTFFNCNVLFQKFLIHKFIDHLPKLNLNDSQIFKQFEILTPNIPQNFPEFEQKKDDERSENNSASNLNVSLSCQYWMQITIFRIHPFIKYIGYRNKLKW